MPILEPVTGEAGTKPVFTVINSYITKKGAVKKPGLIKAIAQYNNLPSTTDKLDVEYNLIDVEHLRLIVKRYITLVDGDGNPLNTMQGEGAPSQPDIIQSTPPPLLYDDIKNDPYFIVG